MAAAQAAIMSLAVRADRGLRRSYRSQLRSMGESERGDEVALGADDIVAGEAAGGLFAKAFLQLLRKLDHARRHRS